LPVAAVRCQLSGVRGSLPEWQPSGGASVPVPEPDPSRAPRGRREGSEGRVGPLLIRPPVPVQTPSPSPEARGLTRSSQSGERGSSRARGRAGTRPVPCRRVESRGSRLPVAGRAPRAEPGAERSGAGDRRDVGSEGSAPGSSRHPNPVASSRRGAVVPDEPGVERWTPARRERGSAVPNRERHPTLSRGRVAGSEERRAERCQRPAERWRPKASRGSEGQGFPPPGSRCRPITRLTGSGDRACRLGEGGGLSKGGREGAEARA